MDNSPTSIDLYWVPLGTGGRFVRFNGGDMWNSNSVVSWLLARSGIDVERIQVPPGGRAPGWEAGVDAARRTPALAPPATAGPAPPRQARRGTSRKV